MNYLEKNIINILTISSICNKNVLHLMIEEIKNSMPFEALMTIEEVAQYLRVKKRTIYEWLKSGKIPAIKAVGQWRFKKDKIDAWLDGKK